MSRIWVKPKLITNRISSKGLMGRKGQCVVNQMITPKSVQVRDRP